MKTKLCEHYEILELFLTKFYNWTDRNVKGKETVSWVNLTSQFQNWKIS